MNSSFDFDQRLSAWLDEQAPMREPDGLAYAVLARTRRTRRLPGWAILERWLPMETTYKFGAVPRTAIVLVILTVLLGVAGAVAVGQEQGVKLPPPTGLARNGLIAFDDGGDIWVVNPDGTGRLALTTGPEWDVAPVWSQDGTQIAYWSEQTQDGIAALKVMDADGTDGRPLVEGLTLSRWSTMPAWSYDGRYLAYSDEDLQGANPQVRINVIPSDGGDPSVLVSSGQDPTWSPDGKWIAYQSGPIDADLLTTDAALSVIGADGKNQRMIAQQLGQTQNTFSFPQWSPDGLKLAYQDFSLGKRRDIFVASADGKEIQDIANQPTDENWPVWSPDEKRIAYDGPSSTAGMWQVVVVDPDGSNPVTLQHAPLGCPCGVKWSPDGTTVTAYLDGPVGHEDTKGSMLLVDASGVVPPVAIPYAGMSNQHVSWQRLAP